MPSTNAMSVDPRAFMRTGWTMGALEWSSATLAGSGEGLNLTDCFFVTIFRYSITASRPGPVKFRNLSLAGSAYLSLQQPPRVLDQLVLPPSPDSASCYLVP